MALYFVDIGLVLSLASIFLTGLLCREIEKRRVEELIAQSGLDSSDY